MPQKPTLFASSLQLFSYGNPMANAQRPEPKGLVEATGNEFDLDINSKLPAELRKALNLDAEDKEWKDVNEIKDLKEGIERRRASKDPVAQAITPDSKSHRLADRNFGKLFSLGIQRAQKAPKHAGDEDWSKVIEWKTK